MEISERVEGRKATAQIYYDCAACTWIVEGEKFGDIWEFVTYAGALQFARRYVSGKVK